MSNFLFLQKCVPCEGGSGGAVLGQQHSRRSLGLAEPVSVRAIRALGEVHVRAPADVLSGRVQVRAAVQTSPIVGLRPEQRVQRDIFGLVPVPVLLRVQMLQHSLGVPRDFQKPQEQRDQWLSQARRAHVVQEAKRKNVIWLRERIDVPTP